jgi:hypothetical protein
VLLYGPVNLVTILFYSSPLILPFVLFAIRHSDSEGFRALRGLVDFFYFNNNNVHVGIANLGVILISLII